MIDESGTCGCGLQKRLVNLYTPEHVFKESVWDCMNDECPHSIMFNANKAMPGDDVVDDDGEIDPMDEVDWNNYEGDYSEFAD